MHCAILSPNQLHQARFWCNTKVQKLLNLSLMFKKCNLNNRIQVFIYWHNYCLSLFQIMVLLGQTSIFD